MKRRDFLKTTAATISLAVTRTDTATGNDSQSWMAEICHYLESLRRPDGGYAWPDQSRSHLTPSFAAIGCYHLLEQEPPDKNALVEFLQTHHPFHIKKLAYQDYYHAYHMTRPVVGRHNATAVVRVLADQTETSHTIEFIV